MILNVMILFYNESQKIKTVTSALWADMDRLMKVRIEFIRKFFRTKFSSGGIMTSRVKRSCLNNSSFMLHHFLNDTIAFRLSALFLTHYFCFKTPQPENLTTS